MRKLKVAALAAVAAGGLLAGCASDPYYDGYASRTYDPYYANNYYTGPVYAPGYAYSDSTAALSVLGALIGGTDYGRVPVDRYGPNPDGMIAADGHRIHCRLRSGYDSYYGATVVRRICR